MSLTLIKRRNNVVWPVGRVKDQTEWLERASLIMTDPMTPITDYDDI